MVALGEDVWEGGVTAVLTQIPEITSSAPTSSVTFRFSPLCHEEACCPLEVCGAGERERVTAS